tara:strand:- start:24 stop:575 length:552 start_codon:yes stop_codon:yes gene_type:complete
MSKRTQNIFKRQLISFNSNFRIDSANPQMGISGTDVYKIYGVTDSGYQSNISLSSSGMMSILNDKKLEIVAGEKCGEKEDIILITTKNGNLCITADDGVVRIRAENIMIEADEDIQMKAGRNIDLNAGSGRIMLDANKIDYDGSLGKFIRDLGESFTQKVFEGSFVASSIVDTDIKLVKNTIS